MHLVGVYCLGECFNIYRKWFECLTFDQNCLIGHINIKLSYTYYKGEDVKPNKYLVVLIAWLENIETYFSYFLRCDKNGLPESEATEIGWRMLKCHLIILLACYILPD